MKNRNSAKFFTMASLLSAFMAVTPAFAATGSEAPAPAPHDHGAAVQKKTAPVITVSIVSNIHGVGTLQTLNFNSEKEFRTYIDTGLDPVHIQNLHADAGAGIPVNPTPNYSPALQMQGLKSGYAHFEIDGNFTEEDSAKFSGWNMSGLDFSGAKIRNMLFTGVWAAGANFNGADIDNTMLAGMHAPGSSWKNVTFGENVKASGCIEGVTTDFSNVDFTGTPFRNMNWGRATLDGATLPHIIDGTNLEGASLKNVNAYRTVFSNSYIAFTNIEGANLAESTFHDMGPIMDITFNQETALFGIKYTGNSVPALKLREQQEKQEGIAPAAPASSSVPAPTLHAWRPGR